MFDFLRIKIFHSFIIFVHPKGKRPSAMVSLNFETGTKGWLSPMSESQGQLKGARFAKNGDTAGVSISSLNNWNHWLGLQKSCL